MPRSYDVIIVGAGPAGSTLARQLASRGIPVLVLERATLPRYKCCAGGLTFRAAQLLGMNLDDVVEGVISSVTVTFAGNSPFQGYSVEPVMYTVMRDKFDHWLVKKAEEAGATILQGVPVRAIQANHGGVEVFTTAGDFRCEIAVGADGAQSLLARAMGIEKRGARIVGIESEVVVAEEALARWKSRIAIDIGCIRGGYGWVFPKSGHLSVGVACLAERARGLKHSFSEFLDSLSLGSYRTAGMAGGVLPVCVGNTVVARGRVVLLGDAAGLADPLTGEGLYHAILSAKLAAPVIEESLKAGEARLDAYGTLVAEKIVSQMKIAYVFSKVLQLLPGRLFGVLSKDERVWHACCRLLRAEIDYQTIKDRVAGLSVLYNLAFRG